MATLDHSITELPLHLLPDAVRGAYRAHFTHLVQTHQASPLVLPYSLIGPFIIPTIWLAIPHTRRPWLYSARWFMVAWVAWFNISVIRHTSSTNIAFSYAAGLMAAWGLISTLGIAVWMRPQFEAARVVRREKKKAAVNGSITKGQENGLRLRKGESKAEGKQHDEDEYEYIWERFPTDAPFAKRLNWAFDMTTNFRFAGWNWSISAVPRPDRQACQDLSSPVPMSTIPITTHTGYDRQLTEKSFVRNRLRTIVTMYLLVDFLSVFMMKDPYFILGPDNSYSLPPHLENIPVWALLAYRELFSMAGIIGAITGVFNLNDLAQYYLASYLFPMRGELWQHSSTFGSFWQVFDRGLAGFWGGWWHQTFRAQFVAPSKWLSDNGLVAKGGVGSILAMTIASFAQSGFLHFSGSCSTLPRTKLWRSPLFFAFQAFGVILQSSLSIAAKQPLSQVPRRVRQAGNLAITMAWLYFTARFFVDDLAAAGIWLLEPVPASLFRPLGLGHSGDNWWRWDQHYSPSWYSAEHWWQSGLTWHSTV